MILYLVREVVIGFLDNKSKNCEGGSYHVRDYQREVFIEFLERNQREEG